MPAEGPLAPTEAPAVSPAEQTNQARAAEDARLTGLGMPSATNPPQPTQIEPTAQPAPPAALPAPGQANVPPEAQPGGFKPSLDLAAQAAADRAEEVRRARVTEDQRLTALGAPNATAQEAAQQTAAQIPVDPANPAASIAAIAAAPVTQAGVEQQIAPAQGVPEAEHTAVANSITDLALELQHLQNQLAATPKEARPALEERISQVQRQLYDARVAANQQYGPEAADRMATLAAEAFNLSKNALPRVPVPQTVAESATTAAKSATSASEVGDSTKAYVVRELGTHGSSVVFSTDDATEAKTKLRFLIGQDPEGRYSIEQTVPKEGTTVPNTGTATTPVSGRLPSTPELSVTGTKTTRHPQDGAITRVTLSDGRAFDMYRDPESKTWRVTPEHSPGVGIDRQYSDFLGDSKQEAVAAVLQRADKLVNPIQTKGAEGTAPVVNYQNATVSQEVTLEDGTTAKLTMKSAEAVQSLDERIAACEDLLGCLG
jgi:hypothetical protein